MPTVPHDLTEANRDNTSVTESTERIILPMTNMKDEGWLAD